MTITEYQQAVDNWISEHGVRYFRELTNMALLTEEVGELSRLLARKYGEQSFKKESQPADVMMAIAEEMADIFFVITCLANQTGIDLQQAITDNMLKKTTRDASRHHENPKLK